MLAIMALLGGATIVDVSGLRVKHTAYGSRFLEIPISKFLYSLLTIVCLQSGQIPL